MRITSIRRILLTVLFLYLGSSVFGQGKMPLPQALDSINTLLSVPFKNLEISHFHEISRKDLAFGKFVGYDRYFVSVDDSTTHVILGFPVHGIQIGLDKDSVINSFYFVVNDKKELFDAAVKAYGKEESKWHATTTMGDYVEDDWMDSLHIWKHGKYFFQVAENAILQNLTIYQNKNVIVITKPLGDGR